MPFIFELIRYRLVFNFEAYTSRGKMSDKTCWFIVVRDKDGKWGLGECGPLRGLSTDDLPDFESQVRHWLANHPFREAMLSRESINHYVLSVPGHLPSLKFGLEIALMDLYNGGKRMIFDTPFYSGDEKLPINGLVWMGDIPTMRLRIDEVLNKNFACIKLKIGAHYIDEELALIDSIRSTYGDKLEIRVDANGGFTSDKARVVMQHLASINVHSIEQPIPVGHRKELASLCRDSPLPIALDEELIGVNTTGSRERLLDAVQPQYIILKPSLLGGFNSTDEWIKLADEKGIGWWITSALESNVGLNAICQYTSQFRPTMAQGLGTGTLYMNNLTSPLRVCDGFIFTDQQHEWDYRALKDELG